jgi:hypothetical protein
MATTDHRDEATNARSRRLQPRLFLQAIVFSLVVCLVPTIVLVAGSSASDLDPARTTTPARLVHPVAPAAPDETWAADESGAGMRPDAAH